MNYNIITQNILKKIYKRRDNWSYKGNFGKALIIGGSVNYTGSPIFVALSALRCGIDVTKLIAPKRAADIAAAFSPEIISLPIDDDYLGPAAAYTIKNNIDWCNVIEIGNGIEIGKDQTELVNTLLRNVKKKVVIDADAIKVLDKNLLSSNMLLTPNSFEFDTLFGSKLSTDLDERVSLVKTMAKKYDINILLKGHVDIVSDGETVSVNKVNSVYMTKGGTGDVLSGICTGLIGQGLSLFDAACAAAFINGYTGRSIARVKREALSPLDIIENLYLTITKWRYK